MDMGRAFREGISPERRVRFKQRIPRLRDLGRRASLSRLQSSSAQRVPAMITLEDDEWIWEQVSSEVLASLSHRLMVEDVDGSTRPLGCTADFETALALAREMADAGQVVLIEANP